MQQLAYLTGTPTLRVNARDPFSAYPVRSDGLFTLTRAVDLDTGQVLTLDERLLVSYFQRQRNIGHALNAAPEVLAAVEEMHHGVVDGWSDSPGQASVRTAVTLEAGTEGARAQLGPWRADAGFLGDGRLARVQAERMAA